MHALCRAFCALSASTLTLAACGGGTEQRSDPVASATAATDPVAHLVDQACTVGTFGAATKTTGLEYCRDYVARQVADLCGPADVPLPVEQLVERCEMGMQMLTGWAQPTKDTFSYGGEALEEPTSSPEPPARLPLDSLSADEWAGLSDPQREDKIAGVKSKLEDNCREPSAAIAKRVSNWYAAFGEDRSVGGVLADICTG
jgi:hypothetical protein